MDMLGSPPCTVGALFGVGDAEGDEEWFQRAHEGLLSAETAGTKRERTRAEVRTCRNPRADKAGGRGERKTRRARAGGGMEDVEHMLAEHNSKFVSHTYEPRHRSARAVAAWERRTGRSYAKLTVAERRLANREIEAWLGGKR